MAEKKMRSLAPRAGRPKKYTADQLRRAVEKYFRGIGKTRSVVEMVESGELDKYGHPIMEQELVCDDDGELLTEWVWIRPPTVGGLCRALGIHRSTWSLWADDAELCEVVEWARDVMQGYLEEELLTRAGKDTRGVEFALSANYGVKEQKAVEITGPGLDWSKMPDDELAKIAGFAGCMDDDTEKLWEELTDV